MIRLTFALLIAGATPACAQDHHGHAQHHENFYLHLKQPGTNMSCCNNSDCRPADHRVQADGTIQFKVAGRWLTVPADRTMEVLTPDEAGHWCGVRESTPTPHTYCAILPRAGS